MLSVKNLIERKQARLQRIVNQGRLSQAEANYQVLQYAKLACKILG
jgi:hypothetical protein